MSRTLASLALATGVVLGLAPSPAAAQTQPLARVVSIVVDELVPDGDGLIAEATVTLDVAGRTVTRAVEIPIALDGLTTDAQGCPILFLSLGPLELDLLGLVVTLDDCEGGPVEVAITAVPGDGNLLGNLLCAIARLLDDGLDLGEFLDLLDDDLGGQLVGVPGLTGLDALEQALNRLLAGLVASLPTPGGGGDEAGRCDILTLELPEGLFVDLLGLEVQTSGICLDVFAVAGPGNLLGNLLCSLTDLLNNRGNTLRAQLVLLRNIGRVLDQLIQLGELSPVG